MSSSSSPSSSNNNKNKNDALNTPKKSSIKRIDPDTPISEKRGTVRFDSEDKEYEVPLSNPSKSKIRGSMSVELNEYLANNKGKIDEIVEEHRKIRELIAFLDKNKHKFTLEQVTRFSEGISKASKFTNDKIEKYKKDLESLQFICSCNYHFDYPARLRLKNIFDNSKSFSWICNNKLKGLFNEKNIYYASFFTSFLL